jgi:hypothetical protein
VLRNDDPAGLIIEPKSFLDPGRNLYANNVADG